MTEHFPEDELVADLLQELGRVALLPLHELDDFQPGPALGLALLVLGVAPVKGKRLVNGGRNILWDKALGWVDWKLSLP